MTSRSRLGAIVALALAVLIAVPAEAFAHEERNARFPSGRGRVPHYRTTGPKLVVCNDGSARRIRRLPPRLRRRNLRLLRICRRRGFSSLQKAINHVRRRGTRILVLPGRYLERNVLSKRLSPGCRRIRRRLRRENTTVMTYAQQKHCPHIENVVAFFGDGPDKGIACDGRLCDLQIEGTGRRPKDVVFDGRFKRLNVIRADRADGVYFRNFTVQHARFNALYVIETDGFVIDRMVGRWNDEYGFLTFASDHGLYKRCIAHGNGDSGLYPGSASPHHGARVSIEIRRCRSFHNTLGYSGTAGDSTYVHDNWFYGNSTGASMDSFFPHHPGLPQNSATFIHNYVFDNNVDFYRYYRNGTCYKPMAKRGYDRGVVCPSVPVPIGTGFLTAGGNANMFGLNWIWNNWRYGAMLFWVPASFRDDNDPEDQYDTSHFNRYVDNHLGVSPRGRKLPNGLDFWWDQEGAGNCWSRNHDPRGVTSDPPKLPNCNDTPVFYPGPKVSVMTPCATWSRRNPDPPGCDWMHRPERPSRR